MSQNKINSLQLLRVIAVSLVIFIHVTGFTVDEFKLAKPTNSVNNLMEWGAIGVDLFFCISGFIMTIVAPSYTNPGDWKVFFKRRIVRIMPLYYLLSLIEGFRFVFVHHNHLPIAVIIKSLIFFPFFDNGKFVIPIIGVGWSLSYEMYFYLLISIVLLLKGDIFKKILIITVSLSVLGCFVNNVPSALLRFMLSPILLEFGLGVVCGLIYKRYNDSKLLTSKGIPISVTLIITGLGLMFVTAFIPPGYNISSQSTVENDNIAALYRSFVWGVPCAIFMLGVVLFERYLNWNIPKIAVLAGDASYSCYLMHYHIYAVAIVLFKGLALGPILYLALIIPICLGGSIIFYKIVEMPITKGLTKYFAKQLV